MVSYIVELKFTPEDRAEIAEILRQLAGASRLEPGCVSFIPHQLQDDPDTVLIYEQYKDDAALESHRTTQHFLQYARKDLPKVADRVEGHLYEALG